MLLGGAIERERRVVLLGDVAGVLDPHPLDDVALDVHAEDVAGVHAHLVGVVGQLDAAGLAATADLHLRLDDDRVAGRIGLARPPRRRCRDAARRHRDVVAGEVLLALVLEQVHLVLLAVQRRFQPRADALQRTTRPEDLGHALLAQRTRIGLGDHATTEHQHVVELARPAAPP